MAISSTEGVNNVGSANCDDENGDGTDQERHWLKGFPAVEFIENIEEFLKASGGLSIDAALRKLEETHQRLKIVESAIFARKARIKSKLPDLQHSLELVEVLEEKKDLNEEMQTQFMLSEQCYTTAAVPTTDTVGLWLGANVMLEYSLDEARHLLQKNIASAEKSFSDLGSEMDFIKNQLTTTEVNIARVYNWGVQQKKQQQTHRDAH